MCISNAYCSCQDATFVCVWLTENQIHGLDKEEVEFLDFVHDRQQEIEKERQVEEMSALQELHVFFSLIDRHINTISSRPLYDGVMQRLC